jgi:prophage regulatory protein
MSDMIPAPRLLRLPAVLDRVGLGRSRWYDLVAQGKAPTPVRLSERAVAWRESDVTAWIESREEAR